MNISDLRNKSMDGLRKELLDLMREWFNLRMQKGMSEVPRPHLYKQVRRNIARVKTILKEKECKRE
ncbi:MAG: 50S ribosomal protein L29 [Coxiella-like endosymbiont]|uniref:50S ribosomal protein L29 n=1 Tax=Coxiella-like endosymbiont TaxID=1592897 RepID=UPI00215A1C3F|nr:50S ribosomal protein L29 [Coxiella-like endosymbiont]UVE59771.1 50S ribosomal protein L29 [Coxiella-like endosymbiont]